MGKTITTITIISYYFLNLGSLMMSQLLSCVKSDPGTSKSQMPCFFCRTYSQQSFPMLLINNQYFIFSNVEFTVFCPSTRFYPTSRSSMQVCFTVYFCIILQAQPLFSISSLIRTVHLF